MRTILAAGLLALLSVSVNAAAPAAAKSAPAKAVPVLSDQQIEQEIRARFAKSKIREDKFQVRVQGGTAIIKGKTKVVQRKGAATRLARLAGARSVKNLIEVDPAAKEAAMANLEKGRRRAQVKRSEARTASPAR